MDIPCGRPALPRQPSPRRQRFYSVISARLPSSHPARFFRPPRPGNENNMSTAAAVVSQRCRTNAFFHACRPAGQFPSLTKAKRDVWCVKERVTPAAGACGRVGRQPALQPAHAPRLASVSVSTPPLVRNISRGARHLLRREPEWKAREQSRGAALPYNARPVNYHLTYALTRHPVNANEIRPQPSRLPSSHLTALLVYGENTWPGLPEELCSGSAYQKSPATFALIP